MRLTPRGHAPPRSLPRAAAGCEPRCVAIESAHSTACVRLNDLLRAGRRAEIRRFGLPGTSRRSFEVWAL